jgi:hypothetical protein
MKNSIINNQEMTLLKTYTPSVLAIFLMIFMACSSKNEGKCKFGEPTAMFSDTMKVVKKHHFEIKDKTGVELAAFSNGMMLEVEQSGCNEIHQQFTFILPGDFSKSNDEFWKTLTVKNFRLLAESSPQLIAFTAWADAIESVNSKLKLAEPTEVSKGIEVRIDKILSNNQGMLVVQLSQN